MSAQNEPTSTPSLASPRSTTVNSGPSARLPFNIRRSQAEDLAFIRDSWLESYRVAGFNVLQKPKAYRASQRPTIERLLARSLVLVANPINDPEPILGYVVVEQLPGLPVVHYAYTKGFAEGSGIAKALLAQAGINLSGEVLVTHPTKVCLTRKHRFVWVPELAR